MRDTTHDLQTVLDAIRGEGAWNKSGKITTSAGNVMIVARRLGVHPNTVRNYAKRWNSVAAALEEEQETLIDMAENKLAEKVVEGDNTMIIFLLKAHPKAKARGWSERSQHEVSGKDGGPVETRTTHAIDSDAAGTIFDILAEVGAISAIADDAEDDALHTA